MEGECGGRGGRLETGVRPGARRLQTRPATGIHAHNRWTLLHRQAGLLLLRHPHLLVLILRLKRRRLRHNSKRGHKPYTRQRPGLCVHRRPSRRRLRRIHMPSPSPHCVLKPNSQARLRCGRRRARNDGREGQRAAQAAAQRTGGKSGKVPDRDAPDVRGGRTVVDQRHPTSRTPPPDPGLRQPPS